MYIVIGASKRDRNKRIMKQDIRDGQNGAHLVKSFASYHSNQDGDLHIAKQCEVRQQDNSFILSMFSLKSSSL